jgi:hypothetical protein
MKWLIWGHYGLTFSVWAIFTIFTEVSAVFGILRQLRIVLAITIFLVEVCLGLKITPNKRSASFYLLWNFSISWYVWYILIGSGRQFLQFLCNFDGKL